ncbi:transglutaminase domain-containing protein [Leadbettera azotonutricia]|uniref:Tetratricopeptide repeat family protein n=1 Tax=Leadbettera azotonutricia (strain ATCC BAA-888 / DSM 13862 / ZAS-9) TaxID=545695 RepID=F5Y9Z5_LEAAZ|nr:transglutaminase domain-containing protein [Leadbettera azotonutricia]AEF80633.1 tetratricopeptide repeat family protein [Leadbettera azotonutricia ZAS-9]
MENAAIRKNCPWVLALVPRTAALFILLWQLRFLAADLSDTPVFAAALIGALGAAIFLYWKGARPVAGILAIALVPWAARLFIALPRWLAPNFSSALILDSLLLNLDRNYFAALLPFYWIAVTSFFSLRSRAFLRADIIAADTLFLVLFSIAPSAAMEAYRWPVLMIAVFAGVFFLQILAFMLSLPPEIKLSKKEGVLAAGAVLLLVILGGALFIRPSQEKAAERGGGLLEPKLFRFDFSQVLRLDTEISVNDDLVLIVKKDAEDTHILLRRYTLSGYDKKQGFYRFDAIDEKTHPQRLPDRPTILEENETIQDYRETDQEYYLVNFDSSAFIGMNKPVEVVPFETWDASSFSSAYAVKSHTSEALPFELIDAVPQALFSASSLGLSEEDYKLYTEYGDDGEIEAYAREITQGLDTYWEQVQALYDWLKYGDYRYSLKPGIAPDGDQLKYFLFDVKKGYCSYYAFAFTLMLRSLGIPSRAAAGFFIDPDTNAFDYYPVRADMAHAWVEVWYPGYGWIEYDPTAEELAEGEEFRFSSGTPPEIFERLMKEILDNHSRLKPREGEGEENRKNGLANLGRETLKFVKTTGPFLLLFAVILLFAMLRTGFLLLSLLASGPRRKALFLWAHCKRRLSLGGFRKPPSRAEAEWAKSSDSRFAGFYALYQSYAAARFAQDYMPEDWKLMEENYHLFAGAYHNTVSPGRRVLAWLLPPLALTLRNSKAGTGNGFAVLLLIVLFSLAGDRARAQDVAANPDDIYSFALDAQNAENWERAVELYSMGSKYYPGDLRFPWALGNLYYQRRLFRLAWEEYTRADKLAPWDPDILFQLSRTAAYLNEDTSSAACLEQLLMLEPDNREAIGNLGWMYYKIHRLEEGEALLISAMERMGVDADFSMTLGTIYSDMFNYPEAKYWYQEAIAGAENIGDRLFAAVAHYNLSILESRFYHFDLAYDRTNASLEALNRASGRLAKGELYLRRMALPRALEEYQEAYEMDSSPLSKVNLAQVYQIGGRLEEARLYAEDCLRAGDLSWMLNYGIDPVRYRKDIHEILRNTYQGLEKAEAFVVPANFKEWFRKIFRVVSYKFKAEVHRHLFQKYSLLSGKAYGEYTEAAETHLDALTQYYDAFEHYPRRALAYLRLAGDYEKALIPESAAAYDLEEGELLKNRDLMYETISLFDPQWERDMITEAYTELALRGPRFEKQDAAERAFALNRGSLRQKGLRLPVEIQIEGASQKTAGALKKAAKAAGMDDSPGSRYVLTMRAGESGIEGVVFCELYDGGRGTSVYRGNINLPSLSGSDRAVFSRALSDRVFNGF